MQKNKTVQSIWLTNSCLIVTGIGIGWLVGLSVSPVVSIVITTVTGTAAAIVAALSGLDDKTDEADKRRNSRWSINPIPLALLVLGILIGSIVGITTRNQSLLGSEVSSEVAQWTQAGLTKLTQAEIVNRLFESRYPISGTLSSNASSPPSPPDIKLGSYLFAVSSQECGRLQQALVMASKTSDDSHLTRAIENSTFDGLPKLLAVITDTITLKNFVEQLICPNGQP